ncbi:hypothetical protein ACOMHN_014816 [Nucella lapillus]
MSRRVCDKKCASLLWTLLECIFFSGVVLGWSWLALIFRADHYFLSGCNVTLPDLTSASALPPGLAGSTTPSGGVRVLGRLERRPCRRKKPRSSPLPAAAAAAHHGQNLALVDDRTRVVRHVSQELVNLREPRVQTQEGSARKDHVLGDGRVSSTTSHPSFVPEEDFVKKKKNSSPNEHPTPLTHDLSPQHPHKLVGVGSQNNESVMMMMMMMMMKVTVSSQLPVSLPLPHASLLVGGGGEKEEGEEEKEEEEEGEEVVCSDQREMLRLLLAVVAVLRDLFVFPVGAFFDKYGTTRTRLLTVLIFAVGTLMMTFITQDVPLLMLPALTLTGVAGVAVLLTNIQIANMFGGRRHLVMALYCGASMTSGFITYMMQLSHEQGVHVQTSFMFLTIGLVPMLVSTVAFLPKTRVPWPLPNNYGQRRQQSLDENLLRKQRAWQRRLSEAGVVKLRRQVPEFWPKGGQQLLVGAVVWHGVHSLHTAQAETLLVDFGHVRNGLQADLEHVFGWLQLLSLPLSLLPGLLIDRRRPRELGVEPGTHQMRGILPAMVLASAVALGERAFLMLGVGDGGGAPSGEGEGVGVVVPCLVLAYALHALHRVCFLVVSLAFLLHVHFAQEHLGKYVGLTWSVSACIAALQFPLRFYLKNQPFVTHALLLTLMLLTFTHVINVWNCCRRRLIRDRPRRGQEGEGGGGGGGGGGGCGQALLSIHINSPEPGTRSEGELGETPGACPGTSGCCPGTSSGHGARKSSSCQTEIVGIESARLGSWEQDSGLIQTSGPLLRQEKSSSSPEEEEEEEEDEEEEEEEEEEDSTPGCHSPVSEDLGTSEEAGHRPLSPRQVIMGLAEATPDQDSHGPDLHAGPHRKSPSGSVGDPSAASQRRSEGEECGEGPHKRRIEWQDQKIHLEDDSADKAQQTTAKKTQKEGKRSKGQVRESPREDEMPATPGNCAGSGCTDLDGQRGEGGKNYHLHWRGAKKNRETRGKRETGHLPSSSVMSTSPWICAPDG